MANKSQNLTETIEFCISAADKKKIQRFAKKKKIPVSALLRSAALNAINGN